MTGLITRLIINAIALIVAVALVPGIQGPSFQEASGLVQYLIVGLIFGVVNALIRPILSALSCPLMILTLGLFTFVINAAMLWLTSVISQNLSVTGQAADIPFRVNGFMPALIGSVVVSLVSIILTTLVRDND